jgi:hypothetical protein
MRCRLLTFAVVALCAAGCGSVPSAPTAGSSGTPAATSPAPPAHPAPSTSPSSPASSGCPGGSVSQAVIGDFGSNALTGVQFVSPSQGWVVGRRDILATTNGGASWTVQDRGDLNLVSADFISSTTGWAVGTHTLLFTDDGGLHWTALTEPCPLQSVHFVSASVGFAIAGGSGAQGTATTAPGTGGVVLTTGNGGRTWQRLAAPANPQSVCFSDANSGWLSANGELYSSSDGGRTWTLRSAGVGPVSGRGFMHVQCASGSAWAEEIGPGAASSQEPHVGFHADAGSVVPIFAEQYFPHPGVSVKADPPGPYAGPISAISASTAAIVDWCDVCGDNGTVPWDLATDNGQDLIHEGNVTGINQAAAASFLSPSLGWVVGIAVNGTHPIQRIARTEDGGRSWQVQYSAS